MRASCISRKAIDPMLPWWVLALPAALVCSLVGVLVMLCATPASGPGQGTTWGMSPGRSGAKSMAGACALGHGHEWVPVTDLLRGPVDIASLDWECRRCGAVLLDEERRNELNGQVRDAAQGLERL